MATTTEPSWFKHQTIYMLWTKSYMYQFCTFKKKLLKMNDSFPQSILKFKDANVVFYILMIIRNLSWFNGNNYFHAIILGSYTMLFKKFVNLSKHTLINVQNHVKLDWFMYTSSVIIHVIKEYPKLIYNIHRRFEIYMFCTCSLRTNVYKSSLDIRSHFRWNLSLAL